MSENLKDKTVLIWDDGMCMFIAERLSRDFGKTLLYTPWESDYPKSQDDSVGEGIPHVKRVSSFWDCVDEADLIVFPGLYHSDIQKHLVKLGKRVWGSRKGDELERYRLEAHELFKDLDMPRPEIKVIIGIDRLRKHLQNVDDRYIKVSNYRKDFETWKHINYDLSEPVLNELEHRLGKKSNSYEFLVETPISGDNVVEFGYDGWSIDGKFPEETITGYEIKDVAYCAHVKKHSELSPLQTDFTDKIAETLKKYKYRNFIHTEGRTGKEKLAKIIDVTCRFGLPPTELLIEMISNISEIMYMGADGVMVQPKWEARYGIEIMIDSSWSENKWQAVQVPKSISRFVKFRNYTIIDGTYYIIPKYENFDNVGAVVAMGNSMKECFDKVKEYSDKIKGHKIDIECGSIDKLNEVISKGQKLGIMF
jgi:hypothetical protein